MRKGKMPYVGSYPICDAIGNMTFFGVAREVWWLVSKDWHEQSTFRKYQLILTKLLRQFDPHQALAWYRFSDFESAVEAIKPSKGCPEYSQDYLDHCWFLIRSVYRAGASEGLFEGHLFNSDELAVDAGEKKRAERALMPKSFSFEEEAVVLKWLLSLDPAQTSGEDVGLAIQFLCGTRNNETCGLDYGHIHVMVIGKERIPILRIGMQTSSKKSSELKAGGKTMNAPRQMPLLHWLYDFLVKRREFIKTNLHLSDDQVDLLPIACKGDKYDVRLGSEDMTYAGSRWFAELGITNSVKAILELVKEWGDGGELEEKEYTTYLLRRNALTSWYILGMPKDYREYLAGHVITRSNTKRTDFTNPEKLRDVAHMLDRHWYNTVLDSAWKDPACIKIPAGEGKIHIVIHAREPYDAITIQQTGSVMLTGTMRVGSANPPNGYPKEVHMSEGVRDVFLKILDSQKAEEDKDMSK